jgi:hypothetical protein
MSFSRLVLNSRFQVTCKACKLLEAQCVIREKSTSQLPASSPSLLHNNFAELHSCAIKGCSVCRVIRKALLQECYSKEQRETLHNSASPVFTAFPALGMKYQRSSMSFYAETRISDSLELQGTISLKASNDSVSIAPHATDEEVFQKSKQWLTGCAEQHFECTEQMDIGDPPHNPTRLLDIGTYETSPIKLIESPKNLLVYCALSYCVSLRRNLICLLKCRSLDFMSPRGSGFSLIYGFQSKNFANIALVGRGRP